MSLIDYSVTTKEWWDSRKPSHLSKPSVYIIIDGDTVLFKTMNEEACLNKMISLIHDYPNIVAYKAEELKLNFKLS